MTNSDSGLLFWATLYVVLIDFCVLDVMVSMAVIGAIRVYCLVLAFGIIVPCD